MDAGNEDGGSRGNEGKGGELVEETAKTRGGAMQEMKGGQGLWLRVK